MTLFIHQVALTPLINPHAGAIYAVVPLDYFPARPHALCLTSFFFPLHIT